MNKSEHERECWRQLAREFVDQVPFLFETLSSGFLVINSDLDVLYMNPCGRKVFSSVLEEYPLVELLRSPCLKEFGVLVNHVLEKRETVQRFEFVFRDSESRITWVGVTLNFFLSNPDGRPYVVGIFRDLTEIKFLEQRRNQDINMRSVSYLASGIAHEFNNLFAGLLGYYELFQEDDGFKTKFLSVVESVISRGKEITGKLSQFIMNQSYNRDICDMGQCAQEVCELFSFEMRKRNITLKGDYHSESTLMVNMPRKLMEQCLFNLISNSIHAIDKNGQIEVSVKSEADKVFVIIRDNGKGVQRKDLDHLFAPFYTTKGPLGGGMEEGAGLGLFFVYSAVKRRGGDVFVDSAEGQGTEFVIRLPLKRRSV